MHKWSTSLAIKQSAAHHNESPWSRPHHIFVPLCPGVPEVKLRSVASPQKGAAPGVAVLATTQLRAVSPLHDEVSPQPEVRTKAWEPVHTTSEHVVLHVLL